MQNNNRIVLYLIAIVVLVASVPTEWMTIQASRMTVQGMPSGIPGMSDMSFQVTGLNGSITMLVKVPIWLILLVGGASLVVGIFNETGTTSLHKAAILVPLGIAGLYALIGLLIALGNQAAPGIGMLLALAGFGLGLYAVAASEAPRPAPPSEDF